MPELRLAEPVHTSIRYAIGVAVTAATAAVIWLLAPQPESVPVTFLVLPILFAGWFGGAGPALAATAAATMLANVLLSNPLFSGEGQTVALLRMLGLGLNGLVISALFGELHASRRRLAEVAEARRQQGDVLASSGARLHTVLEHLPAGVVLAEPDGRIGFENGPVAEILGHSLQHVTSFAQYEALGALDADGAPLAVEDYALHRALRGERVQADYRYRRPDGRIVWLRASATPIETAGRVEGALVLFANVDREKEIEAALVASEEQRRLAQAVARIGHFEWHIKTDVNRWSPELEALYGVAPGTFGGSYAAWRERVHPDDIERAEADLASALRDGHFHSQWRAVWPDGTIRWILAEARIFHDADGRPERMLGINMDVTARREADEALRETRLRLELALAASRLGAWHLDLKTRRMDCTPACKANFGRAPHEAFDYDDLLAAIVPEDRPGMQAAVAQAIANREAYSAEYRVRWRDGTMHWIEAQGRVTYAPDGEPLLMDGVTADVTDRRLLERRLQEQARELQEADRRKDEFLATLSHELRNPLSAIEGALQVMKVRPDDAAILERTRSIVERQVRQMTRLVADLTEIARITEGKLSLEQRRVDLTECLRIAAETVRPQIARRAQDLIVDAPPPLPVVGDAARLTQVFVNLLNNASKYGGEGRPITLDAQAVDGYATIQVRDSGLGIPPDMLSRIFEPLAQVSEHRDRSDGGIGLGLALVDRLVALHGGAVSAHSDGPGQGSTFVVRLPLSVAASDIPAAPNASASS